MKKFWKIIIPDFKIRTNLENLYNSFRKTKSEARVKVKKIGRARKDIRWKK